MSRRSYDPLVTLANRVAVLWRRVANLEVIQKNFNQLIQRLEKIERQLEKQQEGNQP
jgi:Tfp pilus assembly protein PilO